MTKQEAFENLCIYDNRNPDYDKDAYRTKREKDCHCDNCFYGRDFLAQEIIKLLTTKGGIMRTTDTIKDVRPGRIKRLKTIMEGNKMDLKIIESVYAVKIRKRRRIKLILEWVAVFIVWGLILLGLYIQI